MAVESENDRLELLEDFGIDVKVDPDSSNSTFKAIYDAGHIEIDNGISLVSTVEPQLLARDSDITTLTQGSVVELNSTRYVIADVQPDGTGMTVLRIHKQ